MVHAQTERAHREVLSRLRWRGIAVDAPEPWQLRQDVVLGARLQRRPCAS